MFCHCSSCSCRVNKKAWNELFPSVFQVWRHAHFLDWIQGKFWPLWLGITYKSTFGAKKQTYTRKDKVNSNKWSPFSFWKAFYRSCTWISINADVFINEETIFVFSLTECTAILDQVGHRMWTDRILFFSYWIYRFCSQFDKVVFQLFIDN